MRHTFLSSASEATHQRHALDRYTFRQSARGLTIHRGATSPILVLRHSCSSTFTIHGSLLVYQGRRFDYYITPADLLHPAPRNNHTYRSVGFVLHERHLPCCVVLCEPPTSSHPPPGARGRGRCQRGCVAARQVGVAAHQHHWPPRIVNLVAILPPPRRDRHMPGLNMGQLRLGKRLYSPRLSPRSFVRSYRDGRILTSCTHLHKHPPGMRLNFGIYRAPSRSRKRGSWQINHASNGPRQRPGACGFPIWQTIGFPK